MRDDDGTVVDKRRGETSQGAWKAMVDACESEEAWSVMLTTEEDGLNMKETTGFCRCVRTP